MRHLHMCITLRYNCGDLDGAEQVLVVFVRSPLKSRCSLFLNVQLAILVDLVMAAQEGLMPGLHASAITPDHP
jgi:hypothetical protein